MPFIARRETSFPITRLFLMVGKARQKFLLCLDDFPTRYRQRKPSPRIHLRKLLDLARPWRPLQSECVALESGGVQIVLHSPCFNDFPAGLFHFAQRYEIAINRDARLLLKFPFGGSKGVLAV